MADQFTAVLKETRHVTSLQSSATATQFYHKNRSIVVRFILYLDYSIVFSSVPVFGINNGIISDKNLQLRVSISDELNWSALLNCIHWDGWNALAKWPSSACFLLRIGNVKSSPVYFYVQKTLNLYHKRCSNFVRVGKTQRWRSHGFKIWNFYCSTTGILFLLFYWSILWTDFKTLI